MASPITTEALSGIAPPGPQGAVGMLHVRAELVTGRTRLTWVDHRPPLQVTRAMDLDPKVPDLASVTVVSPAGGILQGDRLEQEFNVGPRARLSVGTQSAMRVYRSPAADAVSVTRLVVSPGSYLEYLPDPWIPYADSRLDARTTCVVDPDGVLVVSESVMAGRVARGERFALDRFESLVSVERPDGTIVARDCLRLAREEPATYVGRFGDAPVCGMLIVVGGGLGVGLLRDAVDGVATGVAGVSWGASSLPGDAGAWLRVLAPDARSAAVVIGAARAVIRMAVLGAAPPADRRP